LKQQGELPESTKINEGTVVGMEEGEMDEEDDVFDFEDVRIIFQLASF